MGNNQKKDARKVTEQLLPGGKETEKPANLPQENTNPGTMVALKTCLFFSRSQECIFCYSKVIIPTKADLMGTLHLKHTLARQGQTLNAKMLSLVLPAGLFIFLFRLERLNGFY